MICIPALSLLAACALQTEARLLTCEATACRGIGCDEDQLKFDVSLAADQSTASLLVTQSGHTLFAGQPTEFIRSERGELSTRLLFVNEPDERLLSLTEGPPYEAEITVFWSHGSQIVDAVCTQ